MRKNKNVALVVLLGALAFGVGSGVVACDKTDTPEKVDTKVTSLKLTLAKTTLVEGEKTTANVVISPNDATNKKFTLTSSDNGIAKINSDNSITALKAGTCKIKAVSDEDSKISDEVTLTVEKLIVNVTSVALTSTSTKLEMGSTMKIVATVSPENATNKEVTFAVNDPEVADISNEGVLTPKKIGNVTVTATTKDQNKTAQIVIEIIAKREVLRYEAEDAKLTGKCQAVKEANSNASGDYHVGLWEIAGDSAEFTVVAEEATKAEISVCTAWMSASTFNVMFSVYLNGVEWTATNNKAPVASDPTGWFNWGLITLGEMDLNSGDNKIKLVYQGGQTNLDYLEFKSEKKLTKKENEDLKDVEGTTYSIGISEVELTAGSRGLPTKQASGYIGNMSENNGATATWSVTSTGACKVSLYVNIGLGNQRNPKAFILRVNGVDVITEVSLIDDDNAWETFHELRIGNLDLVDGENTITLVATDGTSGNIKGLSIISPNALKETEKTHAVESVSISATLNNIKVGEETTVTVGISPENATNKEYSLSSSNDSILTVTQEGVVHGVAEGNADVIVVTSDGAKTNKVSIHVANNITNYVFEAEDAELSDGLSAAAEAGSNASGDKHVGNWSVGKKIDFFLNVEEDISVDLYASVACIDTNDIKNMFEVKINDEIFTPTCGAATIEPVSGGWFNWFKFNLGTINLVAGNNSVEFTYKGGQTNFDYVSVDSTKAVTKGVDPASIDVEGTTYETKDDIAVTSLASSAYSGESFECYGNFNAVSGAEVKYYVNVSEAGKASVYAYMGLGTSNCPNAIDLVVNNEIVKASIDLMDSENGWNNYHLFRLGNIKLKSGENTIAIRSTGASSGNIQGIKIISASTISFIDKVHSVESVKLDAAHTLLKTGDKIKISGVVLPNTASNKAVTYESSNNAVITVDSDGNVEAMSEGDATITVKTVEGEKTDSVDFKVTDATLSDLTIEADKGLLDGVGAAIEGGSGATEGKHVGNWSAGKSDTLFVNSAADSIAKLSVNMAYFDGKNKDFSEYFDLFVNGEKVYTEGRPTEEGSGWFNWQNIEIATVHLKSGNNEIKLLAKTNQVNLDNIELQGTSTYTEGTDDSKATVGGTEHVFTGKDAVITAGSLGMPSVNGDERVGNFNANVGAAITYNINVDKAGYVNAALVMGIPENDINTLQVKVNGEIQIFEVRIHVDEHKGWDDYYPYQIRNLYLKEGVNTISISQVIAGTSGNFGSLNLTSPNAITKL